MADAHAHGHDEHAHTHAVEHTGAEHASRGTYIQVGVILTVITAIEVGVYYVKALEHVLIPILLVLSVVKFVTVVQFFMHLKYDQKTLSRVFFGPLFLACLVVVGMIMLFKVIPKFAW